MESGTHRMAPVRRAPPHANKRPGHTPGSGRREEAPTTEPPRNRPCGQHVPRTRKSCAGPPTTGLEDPSMTGPCLAPAKPLNFRPSAPPTHGQPETGSHVSARTRHPSHFCPFTRLAPLLPLRRILGPPRVPKPASRHEYVANERQFTPRASQNGPKSLRTDRTLWHNESSVFVWTQPYGHGPKVVLYASSLHFAQGHSW